MQKALGPLPQLSWKCDDGEYAFVRELALHGKICRKITFLFSLKLQHAITVLSFVHHSSFDSSTPEKQWRERIFYVTLWKNLI